MNWEEYERECRRDVVRQCASRDRDICIFRKIWDACTVQQRNELVALLHTLSHIQTCLYRVTGFRLDAPNIATAMFSDVPDEVIDSHPLNKEMSALKRQLYITPEEYLCAIACWKEGDDYIPTKLVWDHPRWPYYNPFRSSEVAPDTEDGK